MQKTYKTVIVGGGASGLLCAVELIRCGINASDVLLLEKNDRVGKKLIATGNGQGNLSNSNIDKTHYYGNKNFIDKFFSLSDKPNIEEYFSKIGIPLCTEKDGKKYPLSKQASAVLDVIRLFLQHNNLIENVSQKVKNITKENNIFKIETTDKIYYSYSVVLAVGGKSSKQFGTDGSSYGLATSFNHKLTDLYPSLVQLKTETQNIKGLKGLKEQVKLSGYVDNKKVGEFTGDILFTDFGISGDTVFKISALLMGRKEGFVNIEFLPSLSEDQIENIISERLRYGFIDKNDILTGIINKKIGLNILKNVKDFSPKNIAKAIKNFKLKVVGSLGFDYSQVTKGGINADDIYPESFESKLTKGLYIVGEAIDVDGDCGGYNLDFAFSSGIIAGRNICNTYKN